MNIREIACKILKKMEHRRDIDGIEIYLQRSKSTTIEVKDKEVHALDIADDYGAAVRVLYKGKMGFSYSSDLSDDAIEKLCLRVMESTETVTKDDNYNLVMPLNGEYPDVAIFDERLRDIKEEEMIEKTMELEDAAMGYDSRIVKIRKGAARFSDYDVVIINSSGLDIGYSGTLYSASITPVAEENGDTQMGDDFIICRFYDDFDLKKVGENASKNAVELLGAKKINSMKIPVILSNIVSAEFLGILSPSFYGDNIIKGKSLLIGRDGTRIISDRITIIDDGRLPDGMGSAPADDEGTPMKRKVLVKDGILKSFLYDSYTAKSENRKSTGNGIRNGFKGVPGVGVTNLFIERGEKNMASLISQVEKGVYVNEVMGIHTADPISGDFSVGITGFFIEKGMFAYPIRESIISGNILDLFGSIEDVADNMRFIGRVGSPSLLSGNLSVSGN
ncbi:MAG: TldD/PmbA family protein [Nitrospirota bacterium]